MWKKGHKRGPMSEEHKRKIGDANKKTCTPEIRARYSRMYKGKKRPEFSGKNHPMWGERHSEEAKKKMSISRRGKVYMSPEKYKAIADLNRGRKRPPETG